MLNKVLSITRNTAFWTLDTLKGSLIKKAYIEIRDIDNMDSTDDKVQIYQKENLNKLLTAAKSNTNFYKNIKSNNLSDFPVINKNLMKNSIEKFISNKYSAKDLISMSTSGSTGTPFIVYQNIEKKKRVNAEVIYYSEKAGYSVGKNLIFLRALTDKSKKSKIQQWIQNETLIDISNLSEKHVDKILHKIMKTSSSGSMILAYASTYDALKDYFRKHKNFNLDKGRITGIVSSSEMLFDDTRETMQSAFNCKCISRYSNQENGIIGQDNEFNNVFILNESNYIIEILKMDEDTLVVDGEVGRLIITDLFNYAMPMIRYDTGDIGSIVYVKQNGILKKAIKNFGGRRIDVVFDTFGKRLSPHIITNNLWSFPEIQQFQFIQESENKYTLIVSVNDIFKRENELKTLLVKLLGATAIVEIKKVKELPVLASGKRKYIINKMNE